MRDDGREWHRGGAECEAEATTTRLMALLRITACKAPKRKAPISSGSRNSAPPKSINPPSAPMITPPPNAAGALRVFDPTIDALLLVVWMLIAPLWY